MTARHVVLVGLMGAGKTTVGRRCAERLGRRFVDVDEVIEATTGRTVRDVFASDGETAFRALERDAIADVCASPDALVIACGGGAVVDPENRRRIRADGVVVWLRAAPKQLASRVATADERDARPLLAGGDPEHALERLATLRELAYEAAAHVVVDTDDRDVEQVVERVLEEIARCAA
jgi:shikimate kinase